MSPHSAQRSSVTIDTLKSDSGMDAKIGPVTHQPRVLVTGAGGFIGARLVSVLAAAGMEVHGLSRRQGVAAARKWHVGDCGDTAFVATVMTQVSPEFVVHLASRTTPGRDLGDFERQIEATILPAVIVARNLPASTRLAVFFGSCEEYGNTAPPFRESGSTMSFSPYGWAKNAAREAVLLVARTLDRPICWVRPFLTFGPGQGPGFLVPDVIRACVRNQTLDLTPGDQTRDFIAVDDVCGMVQRILDFPDGAAGRVVNLCSGQPRTIRSVGEAIRRLVGRGDLRWGALPYRTAEAMQFYGSTDTFERLFGHYQLSDFDHALSETIKTAESSFQTSPQAS